MGASATTLKSRTSTTPISNNTHRIILESSRFSIHRPEIWLLLLASMISSLLIKKAAPSGFTPQYEGLEKIYKPINATHPDQFIILGFPCNQFGSQEPGSDDTIQEFCQLNYGVSFPIMGKTDVNGDKANPLFEWLKEEKPGLLGMKRVKWNFEKWLVGKDGKVKGRWASTTKPEALEKAILEEITKGEGKAGL